MLASGRPALASIVPSDISCAPRAVPKCAAAHDGSATCHETNVLLPADPTESGVITVDGVEYEFYTAYFGGPLLAGRYSVVNAEPADACQPLTSPGVGTRGAVVVVKRGVCSMADKARAVAAAGGAVALLVNTPDSTGMVQAMAENGAPDLLIACAMVSYEVGAMFLSLRDGCVADVRLTRAPNTLFQGLMELQFANGETPVFSDDAVLRKSQLVDLLRVHHPESPTVSWRRRARWVPQQVHGAYRVAVSAFCFCSALWRPRASRETLRASLSREHGMRPRRCRPTP